MAQAAAEALTASLSSPLSLSLSLCVSWLLPAHTKQFIMQNQNMFTAREREREGRGTEREKANEIGKAVQSQLRLELPLWNGCA